MSSVKSILSTLNVKLFIYFWLIEITNIFGSALKEAFWEEAPKEVFLQLVPPGSIWYSCCPASNPPSGNRIHISLANHLFLLLQVACNSGVADMDSIPSVLASFRDGTWPKLILIHLCSPRLLEWLERKASSFCKRVGKININLKRITAILLLWRVSLLGKQPTHKKSVKRCWKLNWLESILQDQ